MRRFPAFLATALIVLAATAVAAAAAAARVPVDNESFTLPGAPLCGFDVDVTVLSNNEQSTTTTLADGTVIEKITGTLVERYTNLDTGATIVRNVSGPTTTTTRPDGTATFVGTGNNRLIFGPTSRANTGEPALVFTSGRVVVNFSANIATGFSLSGRRDNVCALLTAA